MAIPTKKQLKSIINHKTKKQKNKKQNNNHTQLIHVEPDFLKWPYYKLFITNDEKARLLKEFSQLDFKYDSSPYKPILFNRRTPIIPSTFNGEYVKFIDANYLKYDVLPLIYSETELLKCQFRSNPPAITYFEKMKHQLAAEFLKQNKQSHTVCTGLQAPKGNPTATASTSFSGPFCSLFTQGFSPERKREVGLKLNVGGTLAEYREFLFSKVKQCNNFRPTLALQAYNFLNINKSGGDINSKQAILDFSAGWGDRLFAACIGEKKYIGLDPNTNNTHIYDTIIKAHGKPNMQKVIATGAEYIAIPDLKIHMTALNIKQFDLIFTSPPYFNYEIYANATQSISNYLSDSATGFDKWLTYFLFNVIMRYVPLLRDNGYIGIYIQDADKNNYIEPIGLFALAFAEQLGLTVCGIISSTRFPFIVLQKVGARNVLPYKNPDNKKVFNKASVTGLFRKHYPTVYKLCERLLKLNHVGMLTPVLTGNKPEYLHQRNIFIRTFEKVFMQLEPNLMCVQLDKTVTEKIPPYVVQYFSRLLSHFKIKLVTTYVNGNKTNNITTALVIMNSIPNSNEKMQLIPLEPIFANTLDEWQLLNKSLNTGIVNNVTKYFSEIV